MSGEIVRLRAEIDKLAEENYQRYFKIERLRTEVARLRAAGDALCRYVTESGPGLHDDEAVIAYWEQARRG